MLDGCVCVHLGQRIQPPLRQLVVLGFRLAYGNRLGCIRWLKYFNRYLTLFSGKLSALIDPILSLEFEPLNVKSSSS